MTTDEMILALVASGKFTLPAGLFRDGIMDANWWGYVDGTMPDQQAHDLCACHMYREAGEASMPTNSASAIEQLWSRHAR